MNIHKQIASVIAALKNRISRLKSPCPNPPEKSAVCNHKPEPLSAAGNKLLSGKNVLITGAGKNIGKSIALEMARQGSNVYFTDIDQEACIALEKELKGYGVRCRGFVSDVSKAEDSDILHNFFIREKLGIDILVNNVGIQFQQDNIQDLNLTDWHKTFNTNVIGPMYLTRHIANMMISRSIQGCILFVTSIHQTVPGKWICYSSTKGALGMIVKELSLDVAAHGIRVNGIAPGCVSEDEQGIPLSFKYAPLHKTSVNPCYIGRAAVYLASDYFSKFTTGTILTIDAGLSLFHYQMVDDMLRQ